jgi:hypothetical protein
MRRQGDAGQEGEWEQGGLRHLANAGIVHSPLRHPLLQFVQSGLHLARWHDRHAPKSGAGTRC